MDAQPFIQLHRKFAPIPREWEFDDETFDVHAAMDSGGSLYWQGLLEKPRVVILAEAGAGKTREIKEIALSLKGEGKFAFFIRLELLQGEFSDSFDLGSNADFVRWLATDDPAWFFLDSVDEARLVGVKHFEQAIRKVSKALGDAAQRARIFVTSRLTEWRPTTDFELVKQQLPFRKVAEARAEQGDDQGRRKRERISSINTVEKSDETSSPEVYALKPLELPQIRLLATAKSTEDVESFLSELQKSDALLFASRPLDLDELISFWNENKRIGRRKELLDASIRTRLQERDPDRAAQQALTMEDAIRGAKTVAAAATLQKISRIQIPDAVGGQDGINCGELLADWDPLRQRALLARPVFDEAIYGTVRFHHRMVREYLTAQWLHELQKDGKSRREVEKLFFKKQHGVDVLVPSMRPVLAWMILLDENMRSRAMKIAPEIAIEGGDPSELPTELRAQLLNQFCKHYSQDTASHLSLDLPEVRRFAHADLGPTIASLLSEHSTNEEVRQLLLRMVWQADVRSCAATALAYALDTSMDRYTRMIAIRAVSTCGSDSQVSELVAHFDQNESERDDRILADIVEFIGPSRLQVPQLLKLVDRASPLEKHSYSRLEQAVENYWTACRLDQLYDLILGLKRLLDSPPLVERRYFEVSVAHGWLLKHAAHACQRLVERKHPDALRPDAIAVISTSQAASAYDPYDMTKHKLHDLVRAWPELNHALFWYDIQHRRERLEQKDEHLTEWWRAAASDPYWSFQEGDFDRIVADIEGQAFEDDRLVAVSLAFRIYVEAGRQPSMRQRLWQEVRGQPTLEQNLKHFMKPPKRGDDHHKWKKTEAGYKKRQQERKRKEAQNHAEWEDYLSKNVALLRDTRHSKTGTIWNAQHYLSEWLREQDRDIARWTHGSWQLLVPEFGKEIAEAFRDGAIQYWKEYSPPLRSEGIENSNSVTHGTIFGLTGLEYASQQSPNWTSSVTPELATLACRYAFLELNGFPSWIQSLYEAFPEQVTTSFLNEIRWELAQYDGETECHYVLSDVVWHGEWLRSGIAPRLMEFLSTFSPKHDVSARQCLAIILGCNEMPGSEIAALARANLEGLLSPSRKAIWFAAWNAVDANNGIPALKTELEAMAADQNSATEFSIDFANALLGDRRESFAQSRQDYATPNGLVELYTLMLAHVRPEDDIERAGKGVYSPGARDHAQDARNRIFNLLVEIPGKETYVALKDLEGRFPNRPWYGTHAKRRAEKDAEMQAWASEDILAFAKESERLPRDHQALFELVASRLLDLKSHLEEADDSIASILIKTKYETEIRNFFGNWLRDRSLGRYSVPQEEELADAKRPDLRVHGCGFDGPVPIELKIADNGNWSGPDLFERLENQLCGDYLRDSRSNSGMFLLVNRGEKSYWGHPNKTDRLDFESLVLALQCHVDGFIADKPGIQDVRVIGVDLTRRSTPAFDHS
jgi:hypothetical protein